MQVNNQLAETLPDDRFITAFIGLLDPPTHRLRFHSGGQGPILHFQAATGACARYRPTSFPLGAMPLARLRPAVDARTCSPATSWCCCPTASTSTHDARGEQFGEERVERPRRGAHRGRRRASCSPSCCRPSTPSPHGAPQEDDMTVVLVRRSATPDRDDRAPAFGRSFDSLDAIFAFTAEFFARAGIDAGLLPDRRPRAGGALHQHGQVRRRERGRRPHRDGRDRRRRRSDADRL